MNLVELLTAVAVVAILAGTSFNSSRRPLAHQQLLAATRQLELGIEQARDQAMDQQAPCALALGEAGWIAPTGGSLPGCRHAVRPLLAGDRQQALQLDHNISELQFTANGLVLGGGTVRLAVDGLAQERCLVISMPLGITRQGLWSEGQCLPAANANS
jgi:type II secretory pathway pseudopilin PulG